MEEKEDEGQEEKTRKRGDEKNRRNERKWKKGSESWRQGANELHQRYHRTAAVRLQAALLFGTVLRYLLRYRQCQCRSRSQRNRNSLFNLSPSDRSGRRERLKSPRYRDDRQACLRALVAKKAPARGGCGERFSASSACSQWSGSQLPVRCQAGGEPGDALEPKESGTHRGCRGRRGPVGGPLRRRWEMFKASR